MEYNGLKIYLINEHSDVDIKYISLVKFPANMRDFIAMAEQKSDQIRYEVGNEEKRIVFGLVISPNTPYFRRDDKRGEFYAVYTPEAIQMAAEGFLRNGRGKSNIVAHNEASETDEIYLIESFIKDTARGISPLRFEDVPDGSWFAAYKVLSDDVWAKIKDGTYGGFSIHGTGSYQSSGEYDQIAMLAEEIITLLQNN